MKYRILVGSPGMVMGRPVGDSVWLQKGEHVCRERRPVRGFWNGLKGQVDTSKAKVNRTVQAEFEEDFISWANTQRFMRQDLKELVLETQSEIVSELTLGLDAQDFIEVIGQRAQRPMGIHLGNRRDREALVMGGQINVP